VLTDGAARYTVLEWLFFNAGGTGPMLGQLGYFTKFAQEKVPHAIERYTKEADRLFKVLDKRFGESKYIAGDDFTIADVMNFTWPNAARGFLGMDLSSYPNLVRWLDEVAARPAVQKALAMKKPA
jgi:GST-like protein